MQMTDSINIQHIETNPASTYRWYAARIISSVSSIAKRLACDGIHCYRTKFAPGIIFMRCTAQFTSELLSEFWGKIYFYLDPVVQGVLPRGLCLSIKLLEPAVRALEFGNNLFHQFHEIIDLSCH